MSAPLAIASRRSRVSRRSPSLCVRRSRASPGSTVRRLRHGRVPASGAAGLLVAHDRVRRTHGRAPLGGVRRRGTPCARVRGCGGARTLARLRAVRGRTHRCDAVDPRAARSGRLRPNAPGIPPCRVECRPLPGRARGANALRLLRAGRRDPRSVVSRSRRRAGAHVRAA